MTWFGDARVNSSSRVSGSTCDLPVKAETVQALLAWFVHGVESGAGILLLSAIWKSRDTGNQRLQRRISRREVNGSIFLPRGPGSVGSVSKSVSDIHMKRKENSRLIFPDGNAKLLADVPGFSGRIAGSTRTCCWKFPGPEK